MPGTTEKWYFVMQEFIAFLPSKTEKAMATHSSTLAWKIPWTGKPGRLQSMGSLRVRQDWATSLSLFTFMHWVRKWQPTPVFLPGESQRQWAPVYGVSQSRTQRSDFTFTFHFHALGKEMANHSSVLAWRIPGMGEAWWASVSGVAQSQTWLKQLSSSGGVKEALENFTGFKIL